MTKKFLTPDDSVVCSESVTAAFAGDKLYITQPDCLLMYYGGKLTKMPIRASRLMSEKGKLYAVVGNALCEITESDSVKKIFDFPSPVIDVSEATDGSFWAVTEDFLYLKNGDSFEEICSLPENTVCLAALDNKCKYGETVYVGSSTAGLMSMKGKRRHWAELLPDVTGVLGSDIRTVKIDAMGNLWVGSDNGMNVYDHKSCWLSGKNVFSLPEGSFNGMAFASDGKKYFATDTGLIILGEGKLSYYSFGTWLPYPSVTSVAVSKSGAIAAVTERGISVITPVTMTLSRKAANYDSLAEKYFVRKDGYSVTRRLKKAGDIESGVLLNSDNDGLFTGLYCASQCFRYAVTHEEKAKSNAKRAVEAMIKLTEITGKRGFTARALRYSDEENFGTGDREEWHICEDNPDCEWLGETSSDEMTGHYFAYGLYYDLCADDSEKKKIAETVRAITDHIIENNFHLSDVDGIPTTWANWEPALLNNDDRWYYERGTNSLEILSFLKTAYHVTNDEKYEKVFKKLIKEYHYGMNTMQYKVEDAHIAHIDDQLDFTNIYPLITYTDDESLKEIFKMGLHHHYTYEKIERSPMFNIVYGSLTNNSCNIEEAAAELSEMTLDLVQWQTYNSYRPDLVWDDEQEKAGLPPQLKIPVEYHSRRVEHYDSNPFICDSGCDEFVSSENKKLNRTAFLPGAGGSSSCGKEMMMPYIFLLPYWMGRYHGLLGD